MPNRIIREGILDSERYWGVTLEARQLFWHLMLLADDFGCVSLAPVFVRRRCFDEAPSQIKITKLIEQLVDADLIRAYAAGNGNNGFIPRFRQKMRIMKPKYPAPAESLYSDDPDATEKFKQINGELMKLSGRCRAAACHPSLEVKGKEEKRIEKEVEDPTKSTKQWAQELGIEKQSGESEGTFQVRVIKAVVRHKQPT